MKALITLFLILFSLNGQAEITDEQLRQKAKAYRQKAKIYKREAKDYEKWAYSFEYMSTEWNEKDTTIKKLVKFFNRRFISFKHGIKKTRLNFILCK